MALIELGPPALTAAWSVMGLVLWRREATPQRLNLRPHHAAAALGGVLCLWLVDPVVVVVLVASAVAARSRLRRARVVVTNERYRRALPEVADLLTIGLSSGLSVRRAVSVVARLSDDPVSATLGELDRMVERGHPFVGGCRLVADDHPDVLSGLLAVLAVADRSGASSVSVLQRFADHEREVARRAAQERMRRLPVRLLAPLMLCVLPAFVLLTVVPIVAAVVTDFRLPAL